MHASEKLGNQQEQEGSTKTLLSTVKSCKFEGVLNGVPVKNCCTKKGVSAKGSPGAWDVKFDNNNKLT